MQHPAHPPPQRLLLSLHLPLALRSPLLLLPPCPHPYLAQAPLSQGLQKVHLSVLLSLGLMESLGLRPASSPLGKSTCILLGLCPRRYLSLSQSCRSPFPSFLLGLSQSRTYIWSAYRWMPGAPPETLLCRDLGPTGGCLWTQQWPRPLETLLFMDVW